MIAASVNLALGNAGLMLMLAATTFGALSTAFSIRTGNTRTLRQRAEVRLARARPARCSRS